MLPHVAKFSAAVAVLIEFGEKWAHCKCTLKIKRLVSICDEVQFLTQWSNELGCTW